MLKSTASAKEGHSSYRDLLFDKIQYDTNSAWEYAIINQPSVSMKRNRLIGYWIGERRQNLKPNYNRIPLGKKSYP
jgi:hypothetical protein